MQRLYEKLLRGMSGLEFVEVIYNQKFEEFLLSNNESGSLSGLDSISEYHSSQCKQKII